MGHKRKIFKNVPQGEQLQNDDQSSEFSRHEVACDSPDCKVWSVVVPTKDAQTLLSRRFPCGFCVSTVRQNHQCVAETGSDFVSSPVKSPDTSYLAKCTQEAMKNVGSCYNSSTPTRLKRTWSERTTVQPESSASAPTVNYSTAMLTIDVAANPHKPALQSLNCLNLTTSRTESTKDYQDLSSSSPEASNSSLTLDPASKVSQSIISYRKDVGLTTSESHSYSRILSPLNEEEILSSGNPYIIRPRHSTFTISGHEIAKDTTVSREMLRQSTTYMPNRSTDRQVSAAVSRDGLKPTGINTMNKTVNAHMDLDLGMLLIEAIMLPDVLNSLRILISTVTNESTYNRLLNYRLRTDQHCHLSYWLLDSHEVLVRKHNRMYKLKPIVKPAKLINVNRKYDIVKYPLGHQTTIYIRNIATTP
ncbi:hypothetical protein GJ496_008819 [Pomphorhynchus laevis]|nr:hypothetical protein GJ496_008819 [Pomphorhynchus laevis]